MEKSPDALVVRRRLRFNLTFSNPLNHSLGMQQFWCYLPASAEPPQRLRSVQVSIPHQVRDDVLGHRILALSFDTFPALAQKLVMVTAEVEMGLVVQPSQLTDANVWLGAERYIESDDARICALAAELQRPTPTDTARAIYEWVHPSSTVKNVSH
jgi:hypothetical protein